MRASALLDPVVQYIHMGLDSFSLWTLPSVCQLSTSAHSESITGWPKSPSKLWKHSCSHALGERNGFLIVQETPTNLSSLYINWIWVTYPFPEIEGLTPPPNRPSPGLCQGQFPLRDLGCAWKFGHLNKTGNYQEEESMNGSRLGHQHFNYGRLER